jgi:hypothetical protein
MQQGENKSSSTAGITLDTSAGGHKIASGADSKALIPNGYDVPPI